MLGVSSAREPEVLLTVPPPRRPIGVAIQIQIFMGGGSHSTLEFGTLPYGLLLIFELVGSRAICLLYFG